MIRTAIMLLMLLITTAISAETRPPEWWLYRTGTTFMIIQQKHPVYVFKDGHFLAPQSNIWFVDSGDAFRWLLAGWPKKTNLREFAIISQGFTGLHPKPLPGPEMVPDPNEPPAVTDPNSTTMEIEIYYLPTGSVWHADPDCSYIRDNPDLIHGVLPDDINDVAGRHGCSRCATTD